MSVARRLLDAEPVVLVVSERQAADPLVDALAPAGDGEYRVEAVRDRAAALSAADESVWCVVARASLPDSSGAALAAAFADEQPTIPVLVVGPRAEAGGFAGEVAAAGGRFVPFEQEGADSTTDVLEQAVDAALREGERRHGDRLFRSVLDQFLAAHDVMGFIKDAQGRYVYASDYSGGPDPNKLLGKTGLELASEREYDDMRRRHELAMEVVETGEPLLEQIEQYGEGEGAFWFSHTLVPLYDDEGEVRGVVGLVRDVTDRQRERQALERQVERLERFTSFVSHDLRSPLQLMEGYLELARDGDEDAFEHLGYATDRMAELIDDLEELAREEATTVDLDRTVELVPLAREVWEFLAAPDAELVIELPEATTTSCAESELRPLLENLFKNALDHGGEEVTVRLGGLAGGFYVEDDGPGIPAEERDEVFVEGYTTTEEGTGTGLAIVADVAGTHGWDVEIADGSEGGARFELHNVMMATEPDVGYEPGPEREIADSRDVGAIKTAGSAVQEAPGTWTVRGAGDDIWKDANEFHFAYATLEGPGRIEAHIAELEPVNPFSKAGVMVRSGLDDDAAHGYVGRTVDRGPEVAWRSTPGEPTETQQLRAPAERAEWVRVDRVGRQVTCSLSEDGEDWQVIDQRDVALGDQVHLGLVVCSVIPRALCTARFEDVAVHELRPRTD